MSADTPEPPTRREMAGWLKVCIFSTTLFVAMWLVMSVFFPHAR